ncbi:ribonuclease D [Salinivibrio sharmensis]|uniref:Ribonuclease D n=1 Tax=Salinivibrio sharmensis TaxID=390883 RepID=A0ABX3KL75_9GAMM|nr:ribonuclease D [Salinivibrio sharmensis]OOE91029.1 ribonuclease D [Salinivibrio sharmensis]
MNYQQITSNQQLASICAQLRQQPVVMLDTEFVRTRTFYAQLGLVQIYDGEHLVLIDPLAIDDLSPLWALLSDTRVTKVLHASSEDLEVFQHYAGVLPTPMIDTQIVAAFLGHGVSEGFASLVERYVGVSLDKGESRTDWCARPLTEKQKQYAAADVYYLLPLYQALTKALAQTQWQDAMVEECALLSRKKQLAKSDEAAYLDIKYAWQLNRQQLAVLQALAKWRAKEARRRNMALNFIVKEQHLFKMARYGIRTVEQMNEHGFDKNEVRYHAQTLIKMASQADKTPVVKCPSVITRLVDEPGYKSLIKNIKEQVQTVADQLGLAPEFIGSKKQLNQLITWVWREQCQEEKRPDLATGWRYRIVGKDLLAMIPNAPGT